MGTSPVNYKYTNVVPMTFTDVENFSEQRKMQTNIL